MSLRVTTLTASLALTLSPLTASAVFIDNGVDSGTSGSFVVDVENGGESRTADLTATGAVSGTVSDNVLFDYFTYIDTGNGGVRLSDTNVTSPATLSGDNTVSSAGTLTSAAGNVIDWSVSSSIPSGEARMTSEYTFSTDAGGLGDLRLFRYLDEDVLSISDNVLLTRGSAETGDLELFTIKPDEVVGVSQSGGFTAEQGLNNASFSGWAADIYNNMKPRIGAAGAQSLSADGVIESALVSRGFTDVEGIGSTRGPGDIVSVMGWDVDPSASTATIVTSLGGIPDAAVIPPDNGGGDNSASVPLPGTLSLMLAALAGLGFTRRGRWLRRG